MANVFRLPDIGEGLTEAEIVEWLATVGDEVVADHPLVVVETDKTQAELPAPISGTLLHRGAGEGDVLQVGSILAVIGEPGEEWETNGNPPDADATDSTPPPADGTAVPASGDRPSALPIVRRAAKEAGIDIASIAGSGPGGRVTRADLAAHLDRQARHTAVGERPPLVGTLDESAEDLTSKQSQTKSGASSPEPPAPGRRSAEAGTTIRLSPTRRAIADRLTRSWTEIPHVTTFDSFDATALLTRRRELSASSGRSIPLETLIIRSILPVLTAHPEFNATLEGDALTLHQRHDVGIAVDGPDGLLIGVVHDAGGSSIAELAETIDRLISAARGRSLTREDATGATFTISNIGAVGGGYGTPIIPLGTTAILSIGRAVDTVVARGGGIRIAPMAPLSLSYDHRVIDGALGRVFMAAIVERLADPAPIDAQAP
ncbi:MAG TPA: dihydrolipoamide acetyltransferase family protein [Acidimicrobiia bacterium]|nr:dihydrolipoamide acetyltransferase family protein [Acidimicrobiia bacterium]